MIKLNFNTQFTCDYSILVFILETIANNSYYRVKLLKKKCELKDNCYN